MTRPLPRPPKTEAEALLWLQLIRSRRVGPSTFFRLLREHETAEAALAALPGIAAQAGVEDYAPCPAEVAEREYQTGCRAGARLLAIGTHDYPAQLADISDAPPLLWCHGDPAATRRPALAVVGARNASSLGLRMTRSLVGELGKLGFVIVSGAARGIDRAAHETAMQGGTIAVMAGGVDVPYPPEHRDLLRQIATKGLVLSEQPMGLVPQARNFPQRNRLISGLGLALIVIEAAAKSGSLITARDALDQGREVFAVPGHPFDPRAGGTNHLLRDGAILIRNAEDVVEALGPLAGVDRAAIPQPKPASRPTMAIRDKPDPRATEARILSLLSATPTDEDQLIRDLDLPAATVGPILTELEMMGQIHRKPGGLLSRTTPA